MGKKEEGREKRKEGKEGVWRRGSGGGRKRKKERERKRKGKNREREGKKFRRRERKRPMMEQVSMIEATVLPAASWMALSSGSFGATTGPAVSPKHKPRASK